MKYYLMQPVVKVGCLAEKLLFIIIAGALSRNIEYSAQRLISSVLGLRERSRYDQSVSKRDRLGISWGSVDNIDLLLKSSHTALRLSKSNIYNGGQVSI